MLEKKKVNAISNKKVLWGKENLLAGELLVSIWLSNRYIHSGHFFASKPSIKYLNSKRFLDYVLPYIQATSII